MDKIKRRKKEEEEEEKKEEEEEEKRIGEGGGVKAEGGEGGRVRAEGWGVRAEGGGGGGGGERGGRVEREKKMNEKVITITSKCWLRSTILVEYNFK